MSVPGLAGDDRQQPWLERPLGIGRVDPQPRLQEATLDGILRVIDRSEDEPGRPERNRLIPPHELLARGSITLLGSSDEQRIRHR